MKLSFSLAGPRLETPQSPPWWQQTEEAVCRVGRDHLQCWGLAGETGAVDVLEGGERDTNDLLSCSHYPLKGLVAGRVAGAIPHSDAASQDALDGALCRKCTWWGRGCWLFWVCGGSRDVAVLLLASAAVLLVQERSSVMCTPRKLGAARSPPQSHRWLVREHAECALSWNQQQSPSSSPHSERDCWPCTTQPGGLTSLL